MSAEEFEYKGYNVKIEYEDDPESPREWDNLGTMVCDHSRYNLGDIQVGERLYKSNYPYFASVDEVIEFVGRKDVIALPLYLYDHSGITMNTIGFYDPWDSGKVGYIFVTYEDVRKEYGWKVITADRRAKILEHLTNEVETYDQYLRGDVYGYIVEDAEGNHIDSCWGFFGLKYCKEEAKSLVDWYAEHEQERANFEI